MSGRERLKFFVGALCVLFTIYLLGLVPTLILSGIIWVIDGYREG